MAACGADTKTSASSTTSPAPTTTTSTTTTPTTTTAAPTTSTPTTATTNPCIATAGGTRPQQLQAPAPGTYVYAECAAPSKTYELAISEAGGDARRVPWNAPFGIISGTQSFTNGVNETTATFQLNQATLSCDWTPDLSVIPTALDVGVSWRSDGRCSMDAGQSFHVNRSARVSGMRRFVVGGTAVSVWVVEDELDFLYVDNPRRASTTWHRSAIAYFDPSHGLNVYERTTSEATGQYPQRKTTSVRYLTTFTTKAG